jgi:hypothetical protein
MRQLRVGKFIVASVFAAFLLGAGVASADYAISGEWFGNRGPTINIPIGQFDDACPPGTEINIPFVNPIPASQYVPGPCGRAQKHEFTVVIPGNGTITVPSTAVSVVAQSGTIHSSPIEPGSGSGERGRPAARYDLHLQRSGHASDPKSPVGRPTGCW